VRFLFFLAGGEIAARPVSVAPLRLVSKIFAGLVPIFSATFPRGRFMSMTTLWTLVKLFNKPRTTRRNFKTRRFSTDFRLT
jgi:hypothetical protein